MRHKMTKLQTKEAADPRFHRSLFGKLADFDEKQPPCLIYVENGNYNSGYDLLALDYKMAADLFIDEYMRSQLGNWNAPLTFMVRQALELSHKSLLEGTLLLGNSASSKVMFSHDLGSIWNASRSWLIASGYPIENDRRYKTVDWMTLNFHSVDPTGDLFRFAFSKFAAFKRQKTYDRAGVYLGVLVPYFESTYEFLMHWGSVLTAQRNKSELEKDGEKWEPFFDPEDYPKIADHPWSWLKT
jgi:hypothetical protein